MNHEFQWRNELRKLNIADEPARDLWPDISTRIAKAQIAAPARRLPRAWMAIAATVVFAIAMSFVVYRRDRTSETVLSAAMPAPAPHVEAASNDVPRTALDWAKPADAGLASAARDLDSASAALQQALETRPDAVFLVGMLNRTNSQRMRLLRESGFSG